MPTKLRVTVTLSRELLSKVDRAARATRGASRSGIIEAWLSAAAEQEARRALDQSIARYYDGLSAAERTQDHEWARFSTHSFMVRESRPEPGYSAVKRRKRKRP